MKKSRKSVQASVLSAAYVFVNVARVFAHRPKPGRLCQLFYLSSSAAQPMWAHRGWISGPDGQATRISLATG